MASFTIDAPNGKSYTIEGESAQGALSALMKHLGDSKQPSSAAGDFFKSIPYGIAKGFTAAGSALARATQGEMSQDVDAPTSEQGLEILQREVTGPLHQPEGTAGKLGAAGGEFLGNPSSYVAPGSLPVKAGLAFVSGIGSEAGGQVAEGTPLEGPLRILGGLAGGVGAAKVAAPIEARVASAMRPRTPAPTIQELEAAYKVIRNSPEVKGASVPIDEVRSLANTAEQELIANGNRPTPGSAPRTFSEIERLRPSAPKEPTPQQRLQAEMNWEMLPEQPGVTQASVDDLLAAKRGFGRVAGERKPFPQMGPTEDAAAASSTIPKIDELIESAAPGMQEANKNWSAAQAAKAIDARIQKAEMGAAVNNSGMNIGNKIRQQAFQILNSPGARRGLQENELQMLKELAEGNPTRNTLRWFSNVFGGGGGLGAEITGDIASRHLGPIGWLLSPIGTALKHVEGHLTVKAANRISEAIRSRSPYGKALESSAQRWNEAQDALASNPSPARYAAFSIASRNLANTMSVSGAKIDPAQLIKSVQGPVAAGAQDEQQ